MERKITYILGAGASALKMPLVADFPEKLKHFATQIKTFAIEERGMQDVFNSVQQISVHAGNHFSIDTYAKKLFFLKDINELRKLKAIIDIFLLFEQYLNGLDQRYDAFFCAILNLDQEGKLYFPDYINILSWNYDLQIEFSLNNLQQAYISYKPVVGIYPNIDYDNLKIFKINGSAENIFNDYELIEKFSIAPDYRKDNTYVPEMRIIMHKLIERYFLITTHKITPSIKFAWEDDEDHNMKLQSFLKGISETDIVVFIGYSLPNFNRKIDKMILNSFPNLYKVYIQAAKNNIDGISHRIESIIGEGKVQSINSTDEFYIPMEF